MLFILYVFSLSLAVVYHLVEKDILSYAVMKHLIQLIFIVVKTTATLFRWLVITLIITVNFTPMLRSWT